jgi:hypothetical protein
MTNEKLSREEQVERTVDHILSAKQGYLEALDDIQGQIDAGETLEEISAYIAERQEEKQRLNEYIAQKNAERLAESLEQAKAGNVEHHELFDPDKEEWTEFDPVAALEQLEELEADEGLTQTGIGEDIASVPHAMLKRLTDDSEPVFSDDQKWQVATFGSLNAAAEFRARYYAQPEADRAKFHEAIQKAIDAAKRGEGTKVENLDAFFDSL